MTTANILTLLRILLTPFLLYFLAGERYLTVLALFLVMALTDLFDGVIARRWQQKTLLGSYLDPIADKLLLVSAFVVLALEGLLPTWLVVWTVLRDVIILLSSFFIRLTAGAVAFPPTLWGKLTTCLQLLLVLVVLAVRAFRLPAGGLVTALVWLTFGFTLFSGFHYIHQATRIVARVREAGEDRSL